MKIALVTIYPCGEKITKVFDNANKFIKEFHSLSKMFPEALFYTVNRTTALPPPKKYRGTKIWCGYCRDHREFIETSKFSSPSCEICESSINNYYVVKYNPKLITQHRG